MSVKLGGVQLWWLALITAVIPLLTIHLTFLVSILEGHVAACIPYWESCTSISRTGRHGTAYFIFKGAMLPEALLGVMFWCLNARWLEQLGCRNRGIPWVPWLGLVTGLALAAYVLTLGHGGEGFAQVRRTGVTMYFSLTFINQLLLTGALLNHQVWGRAGRRLLGLCLVTLTVGLLSVLVSVIAPGHYQRMDDGFEWVLAVLVNAHALWVALLWKQSRFQARLWVG
ncbi:hypothetical protein [Marinobacter caseinilyticus]|uniref:hypothetical protein n=1 Tax=Marinobacter caseinilyticus TaxID=2692195 RepID=UPI001407AE6C|nr:hypothetical protein [Marinobacter caseinilyticus]